VLSCFCCYGVSINDDDDDNKTQRQIQPDKLQETCFLIIKSKTKYFTDLGSRPLVAFDRCDVVRCVSRRRGNTGRQRPVVP